ncbi:hypothetical protein AB0P05_33055 [Streptomyces flaveolus]|uniref:hypothetical protein n=1 Tax=Streptomyces flaveolus TaxID=67297 RepID=UPI00341FB13A
MHARSAALVTIAILALTACNEPSQGKAERSTATAGSVSSSSPTDCAPDSDLSQADWMEKCSSESPTADDQPDTELAVGDSFAYTDGVKVKVDTISPITRYGAYDDKPDANQTAFRVTFTITNSRKQPFDLDSLGYDAQGATTGGQTESFYVEPGSKQAGGRLAPGRSGTFTAEYTIAKSDGKTIVFTVSRMDDAWLKNGSVLAEDPHWTGTIK